jgi:hypothetical protein
MITTLIYFYARRSRNISNKDSLRLLKIFTVNAMEAGRRMSLEPTLLEESIFPRAGNGYFCGYIKIKDYDSHNGKQRPTGSNLSGLTWKLAGKGLFCQF